MLEASGWRLYLRGSHYCPVSEFNTRAVHILVLSCKDSGIQGVVCDFVTDASIKSNFLILFCFSMVHKRNSTQIDLGACICMLK